MTPYYEHAGITIYNCDCREVLPSISADCFVTDPPYGIEGGKGGDSRDFGKGKYSCSAWSDTPEYITSVCAESIKVLIAKCRAGAVTPGIRCMDLYPKPIDIGCFWTPAAATHGPWGFTTMHPIFYYGKDWRAGKGAWPTGRQLTEIAEKNGIHAQSRKVRGGGSSLRLPRKPTLCLTTSWAVALRS